MEYQQAKTRFIEGWGQLGAQWGINRTMSQIHALLLCSPKALSTDEVMAQLNISRGNANMNIRELIAWGVVRKSFIKGDRKEYFYALKDIWEVARLIARERKRRELEPLLAVLSEIGQVEGEGIEADALRTVADDIRSVASKADGVLELLGQLDPATFLSWFNRTQTH